MLNTPNEWHNEEEEYTDEELSEDEEYEDGEEYDDEDGEYEGDGGDGGDDGGLKKKLIIASAILFVFLLVVGAIFGAKSLRNKGADKDTKAAVETTADVGIEADSATAGLDVGIDAGSADGTQGAASTGDEVSIDVEVENPSPSPATGAEDGLSVPATSASNGLEVPADMPSVAKSGKKDDTVTIAIGDVGRKNPFAPNGISVGAGKSSSTAVAKESDGLNFEVIEPPELGPERADIQKLLQTKVTGILYDHKKPSAIINIEGADQLVKIGDDLSGFEIIAITQNKVVIREGNNVYRASVGQPLNAERIVNPVEISNLETKFWGARKH